eukprot:gene4081-7370_t
MSEEVFEVEQVDPKIKIISKKEEFLDVPFTIDIFVMSDCLWIWIGNEQAPSLSNLSTAMNSKFSSVPLCTNIFGPQNDTLVNGLAKKLSMKTKKVVYVSYNLEKSKEHQIYVEKTILQNINEWIK